MQFMWHFLVTVSRILCISVIASIMPEITIFCLFVHWFVMVIWLHISTREINFCNHNVFYEFLFYSIFGLVYIFTHVMLNEGKTFWKYVFFYLILCVENFFATLVWILNADEKLKNTLYFQPVVYINFISFFVGIAFMIIYYKFFHPNAGYTQRTNQEVSW